MGKNASINFNIAFYSFIKIGIMESGNEPKRYVGYRILEFFYELLFFGSLIWLLMTCTKRTDWERDTIAGVVIMLISGLALWVLHHPHNDGNKK